MASGLAFFIRSNRANRVSVRFPTTIRIAQHFSTFRRESVELPLPLVEAQSQLRRHFRRYGYDARDSDTRSQRTVIAPRKLAYYGVIWCSVAATGYYYLYIRENDENKERPTAIPMPVVYAASVTQKPQPSLTARDLRRNFNFIADIVEECADAVVCVDIRDTRRLDYFSHGQPSMTNGSGFVVDENGLILTNAHVVMGHPRSAVQIRLADGTVYPGIVEDIDVKSDLATIRITPKAKLPVMKLGVSKDLRPGEWVIAMGSPLSLSNTITAGVVSSVNRTSTELGLFDKDINYIQTDASITFGNSGGPLVNLDGQVVGINSMKVSTGISFAIPIDYARLFLERNEARRSKGITAPSSKRYLGITMLTLNDDMLRALQTRNHYIPAEITQGAVVWKVVIGSPAYRGGLVPGDIVIQINGLPVKSSNAVYQALEKHDVLNMRIYRGNAYYDLIIHPEDVS